MAYDFYLLKNYYIDYAVVRTYLSQNIFKNKKYKDLYINSCIKIFIFK